MCVRVSMSVYICLAKSNELVPISLAEIQNIYIKMYECEIVITIC